MEDKTDSKKSAIRRRAEAQFNARPDTAAVQPEAEVRRVVHELQVHQIELEMQNEELRQARAQLAMLAEQYTDLYDFSPVSYVVVHRDGVIFQANLTFERLMGIDRAMLLGRRMALFVSMHDRVRLSALIDQAFASQTRQVCEVALAKEASLSAPLYVQIEAMVSTDAMECRLVIVDITARCVMEKQLLDSQERHNVLLNTMAEGMMQFDAARKLVMLNASAIRMMDIPTEYILGATLDAGLWRMYREDGSQFIPGTFPLEITLRTGGSVSDVVISVIGRTGASSWLSVNCQPLLHAGEAQPYGAVLTFRDVTRRIMAEKALRNSAELFHTLAERSTDMIARLSTSGIIKYASAACKTILGFAPDEMIGRNGTEFFHPDDLPSLLEGISATILKGNNYTTTSRIRRVDDTWVWVEATIIPVHNPTTGGIDDVMVMSRDITQRKQQHEELQQLAQTDGLTGIANRRQFMQLAFSEHKRSRSLHHKLTIVMIDIDHLKYINDTQGHAVGDQALILFTRTCRSHIREIDVFGRLGGDEFAILLPEEDGPRTRHVMERVRSALAASPITLDGKQVPVTFSAGIAEMQTDKDSLDILLARADDALYQAKAAGRNRVAM